MKKLLISLMLTLSTCYAVDTHIQKLTQTDASMVSAGSEIDLRTEKEHNQVQKFTASYFEGVKKNSTELFLALASCIGSKVSWDRLNKVQNKQNAQIAVMTAGAFGVLLLADSAGNIINWPRYKATQEMLSAIDNGDVARVKEYLEQGIDANQCNCHYVNRVTLEQYCDITPLYFASAKGNAPIVRLLLNHKANVDQQVKGQTALYIAALRGNGEVVKVLLEEGKANIWQTGTNNKNVMQVATGEARKYLAAHYAAMTQQ